MGGTSVNTNFEVPVAQTDIPSTSAVCSPLRPPPEKKRKTDDKRRTDIKTILMDRMRAGVQIKSRFDSRRFKTIKIGSDGLTEDDA